jgi:hypothetical protein
MPVSEYFTTLAPLVGAFFAGGLVVAIAMSVVARLIIGPDLGAKPPKHPQSRWTT